MVQPIILKVPAGEFFKTVDQFEYNRGLRGVLANGISSIDLLVHPFYDLYDANAWPVQLSQKEEMVSRWKERIETVLQKDEHSLLVYVDMDYRDEKFLLAPTGKKPPRTGSSVSTFYDFLHYKSLGDLVCFNLQGVAADWERFVKLQVEFMSYGKEVLGNRLFYPLEFEWHHETPDYEREKSLFEGYLIPYSDDEGYGVTKAHYAGKKPEVYAYGCYLPGCVNDNLNSFLKALGIPSGRGHFLEELSVPPPLSPRK